MNQGARIAQGEILWFLHVDAEVPPFCLDEIKSALRQPEFVGGFFRMRIPRSALIYRLTDGFAHYAGVILRMRCGDHGMFCRRDVFSRIGGFPDVPVLEDVEFFRRLHRVGKIRRIEKRLIVSARRYESVGPMRLTLAYGFIAILYATGMPWPILASLYSRFCQRRE
jgi:GT2 family glycosyltransferase